MISSNDNNTNNVLMHNTNNTNNTNNNNNNTNNNDIGSLASQDFEIFLRDCCGSAAGNCGDLRRLLFSPLQNDRKVLRRFAETTNPRQNCAEKYRNPGS